MSIQWWARWVVKTGKLVVVHEGWIRQLVVASVFQLLVESFIIVLSRLTSGTGIEALDEVHFPASIIWILVFLLAPRTCQMTPIK